MKMQKAKKLYLLKCRENDEEKQGLERLAAMLVSPNYKISL
jgi:hypothetical protein